METNSRHARHHFDIPDLGAFAVVAAEAWLLSPLLGTMLSQQMLPTAEGGGTKLLSCRRRSGPGEGASSFEFSALISTLSLHVGSLFSPGFSAVIYDCSFKHCLEVHADTNYNKY